MKKAEGCRLFLPSPAFALSLPRERLTISRETRASHGASSSAVCSDACRALYSALDRLDSVRACDLLRDRLLRCTRSFTRGASGIVCPPPDQALLSRRLRLRMAGIEADVARERCFLRAGSRADVCVTLRKSWRRVLLTLLPNAG